MLMMRHRVLGLGLGLGLFLACVPAQAQDYNDPFFLYYGFFLPRQAAISATPTVNDTLNAVTATRQATATTNRATLYDPNGNLAPLDDFEGPAGLGGGRARTDDRSRSIASGRFPTGNSNGMGPAQFYSRTARYYPTLRSGKSTNRNVFVGRRSGGYGRASVPNATGGMGMGLGMPGPR
jgi:hypothetical protein